MSDIKTGKEQMDPERKQTAQTAPRRLFPLLRNNANLTTAKLKMSVNT